MGDVIEGSTFWPRSFATERELKFLRAMCRKELLEIPLTLENRMDYWFFVGRTRGMLFAKYATPNDAYARLELINDLLQTEERPRNRTHDVLCVQQYLIGYLQSIQYVFLEMDSSSNP